MTNSQPSTRLRRCAVIPLGAVAIAALAACSPDAGTPARSPAPAFSPSFADPTPAACQLVDTAASLQIYEFASAIGLDKESAELRAGVAKSYRSFATQLTFLASEDPLDLGPALLDWASASDAVARFVATHEPGPGLVVDFGPEHPRWLAAQKAAEKICGHPLPDTRSAGSPSPSGVR